MNPHDLQMMLLLLVSCSSVVCFCHCCLMCCAGRRRLSRAEMDAALIMMANSELLSCSWFHCLFSGMEVGVFVSNARCEFTFHNRFAHWINTVWMLDCKCRTSIYTQCLRQWLQMVLSGLLCFMRALTVPSSWSCQISHSVFRWMMQHELTVS